MRTALIDGDILVYRCGFAAQHNHYDIYDKDNMEMGWIASFPYKKEAVEYMNQYGENKFEVKVRQEVEPLENALQNLSMSIKSILENTNSSAYKIFLTGIGNFREQIATIKGYKANRDPLYKPVHYLQMKEYLLSHWGAEVVNGMEADDAMGIEQSFWENQPPSGTCIHKETIICTIDKDLDMIPGWHYNFTTKQEYFITDEQAQESFYLQLLQGDPTDNIPGIPGIGPKRARLLLDSAGEDFNRTVFSSYQQAFPEESPEQLKARIQEIGTLLWIKRTPDDKWVFDYDISIAG